MDRQGPLWTKGSQAGAGEGRQELAGAYQRPGSQYPPGPERLSSPGPFGASSAWLPWLRNSAKAKHLLALSGRELARTAVSGQRDARSSFFLTCSTVVYRLGGPASGSWRGPGAANPPGAQVELEREERQQLFAGETLTGREHFQVPWK